MNLTPFYLLSICILPRSNGFISKTNLGKVLSLSTTANDVDFLYKKRKLDKNAIIEAFNGFREIVDDPMYIDQQPMNYSIPDIIRTEGFVRNITISHLKNTTLDYVNVANDESFCELKIRFPLLNISGKYNMSFYIDRHNVSTYGNDVFSFEPSNFQIILNFTLAKDEKEGFFIVNKIDWNQTLNSIKINIRNLYGDEEFSAVVNEILTISLPTIHEAYKPVIDQTMSQMAILYWKILFSGSKSYNLEKLIDVFARQVRKK